MNRILQPLFGVILFSGMAFSQNTETFHVVSYNVENLFDIYDDEQKMDEDFTPDGKNNWTEDRYNKKLDDLANVFTSIKPEFPEIIGLIEIENKKVLQDLTLKTSLKNAEYNIIHEESPDIRGIDVALLYKKNSFQEISHKGIPIIFPFDLTSKTRDILYVHGVMGNIDTVHIFINHWPSRRGGLQKSEPKRTFVASVLRQHVDSLLTLNIDAKILIMGDFNDNPVDKSIFEVLLANNIRAGFNKNYLFNLFFDTYNIEGNGSYLYRNNYDMLDNIILSQSFIKGKNYKTTFESGIIYAPEWLCVKSNEKKEPLRTYKGQNYIGGYSDHFPVYFVLTKSSE